MTARERAIEAATSVVFVTESMAADIIDHALTDSLLIDLLIERGALEHMSNVPSRSGTRRLFVDMTEGGASDD